MKFDYHTHHERCGHAIGSIEEYILSAIENNLEFIGIADHAPHFYHQDDHPYKHKAMAKSQFPEYINEIINLKQKYKDKITVLIGIESDFFLEYIDIYKQELAKYPLDYIIGSVHRVNNMSVFNEERWRNLSQSEIQQTITDYYQLIEASAKCGLFQIIGHMDVMKRTYPDFSTTHIKQLEKTLQVISENELVIEVNTSGAQFKNVGWYPSTEILERANYFGIIPTFGSDAHTPNRVGDSFNEVKVFLKELGFKKMAYFINKKKYTITI